MLSAPIQYNADGEPTTVIERIYTTKGDNCYDADGVKNDKMLGVVIKGDIYWLEEDFARVSELKHKLAKFNILISDCGKWGVEDTDGSTVFTHKITKISKHHDDILMEGSTYRKRTKHNPANGRLFWQIQEIFDYIYADEVAATAEAQPNTKPLIQGDLVEWRNEFGTIAGNFRGLTENDSKAVIVSNGTQMAAPISEIYRA